MSRGWRRVNKVADRSGAELRRVSLDDVHAALSPIDEIIEDMRNGRMVILIDDEDRENEGDLVVAAQMATPDVVNFMARYGRGLVCLALTPQRVDQLGLGLMSRHNETRMQTAFTTSIEAREGVTTGISASDRARTIAVAIDPTKGRRDIVSPGHVFPLVAREGGVLVRAGHTEAAVDIARLAGLNPSGVICEIMNDDGTMARLPDLVAFAQRHGLKIATIADLIAYRRRNDTIVERIIETRITLRHGGEFRLILYVNKVSYAEHMALVKGDISGDEPVLVRMHAVNALDDLLHDTSVGRGDWLEAGMRALGDAGRGVMVLIREWQPQMLSKLVRQRYHLYSDVGTGTELDAMHAPPDEEPGPPALRDYGVGAQILLDLGVRDMVLLSNVRRPIVGLEGYGLRIVEQRPIPGTDE
jgi:3,4-dihydroxy 2-butanone 4-phosphate synthase / GTP cyclohydrolase II